MSNYMPHELLIEILKRLPIKSLLRFRCICKSWYSLITNPNFITMHNSHAINNNRTHLLFPIPSRNQWRIHHNNESLSPNQDLEFQFSSQAPHKSFSIVGSCNGLLCLLVSLLSEALSGKIILWNPAIRISVILPTPYVFNDKVLSTIIHGFGFDSNTNDFKVVRIAYYSFDKTPEVELYKLSTNSWRIISVLPPSCDLKYATSPAFVNGAVHWIARRIFPREQQIIIAFDTGSERFGEINLPGGSFLESSPIVYQQFLALVDYTPNYHCCIWVMKEYGVAESWTQQFSIDVRCQGEWWMALGFRNDNEILLTMYNGEIVSYDTETRRIICHEISINCGDLLYLYMESLFLLEKVNEVSREGSTYDAVSYKNEDCRVERAKRLKKA